MREKSAGPIPKEKAMALLFERWSPIQAVETVPLQDAAGRVLAEDCFAKYDIPMVRASGMDGVGFNFDLFEKGTPDTTTWRPGREYVRADTGDDFDDAYDSVIAIERVTIQPDGGLIFDPEAKLERGMGVRPKGSRCEKGSLQGVKGTIITALDFAALGMAGLSEVPVVKKPLVAFIPTGNELVPLGAKLERGQSFDTNSVMAQQMLKEMGAEPWIFPIVKDDRAALSKAMDEALAKADIVVLNAGTSKGGEDFGHLLLEEKGERLCHGIALVPGRPMSLAVCQNKPVINVAGPSIAAFYGMDWIVRASVARALGISVPQRAKVTATLSAPMKVPPMFSGMSRLVVKKEDDGTYRATPLSFFEKEKKVPPAEQLTFNGLYFSSIGEQPHEAGESIQVEMLRSF